MMILKRNFLCKGLGLLVGISSICLSLSARTSPVEVKFNAKTGAISQLNIQGDQDRMDWLTATDGSQYTWIGEKYGWGLGYFTENIGGKSIRREWYLPQNVSSDGLEVYYRVGELGIRVKRHQESEDWIEEYEFRNEGKKTVNLSDIGIYTPFNDNYPDARTCVHNRTNVHIWAGENAAYICALRMGGYAPHLGVVLTEGCIKSYEISERGINKQNSQTRGLFSLNPADMQLKSGEVGRLAWRIFSHAGVEDFRNKIVALGGVFVECDKYVYEKGDTADIRLHGNLKECTMMQDRISLPMHKEDNVWTVKVPMDRTGEVRFDFLYGNGKRTHADCLVVSNVKEIIGKRTAFIRTRQQMDNRSDLRYGAYMVYDNEGDSIYLNDTPNCNPVDRDEGAERLGMGILLAKQYLLTKDDRLKTSLLKYAKFLREKLQTKDYVTYSSVDQKGRNRGYNYTWAADFYFLMYRVTGNKQYAVDGYQTLQSLFRQFGYGFYSIEIPVQLGLQVLKDAGMNEEYEDLKDDFIQTGDVFVKNGLDYPAHEVNYEQSIVAPAICFLAQLYLETGIKKYLDEVKQQMPLLEAFSGFQPSYHLNGIAIRHWDGYWFGKREMFGDTFPHYWSTITGAAFHYYALCTGDRSYQQRAENIVRNNLCLFFEDGKASCAYLYPYKINGVKAQFYDPYANDQDWALVYYLLVNENL